MAQLIYQSTTMQSFSIHRKDVKPWKKQANLETSADSLTTAAKATPQQL